MFGDITSLGDASSWEDVSTWETLDVGDASSLGDVSIWEILDMGDTSSLGDVSRSSGEPVLSVFKVTGVDDHAFNISRVQSTSLSTRSGQADPEVTAVLRRIHLVFRHSARLRAHSSRLYNSSGSDLCGGVSWRSSAPAG